MKLIYQKDKAAWINGVPARDLETEDVQKIADEWRMSLAETEGLLISRGYYKPETKSATKVVPTPEDKTDKNEV